MVQYRQRCNRRGLIRPMSHSGVHIIITMKLCELPEMKWASLLTVILTKCLHHTWQNALRSWQLWLVVRERHVEFGTSIGSVERLPWLFWMILFQRWAILNPVPWHNTDYHTPRWQSIYNLAQSYGYHLTYGSSSLWGKCKISKGHKLPLFKKKPQTWVSSLGSLTICSGPRHRPL